MYSMSRDIYICDICGFEEPWNAHDDHRGDIWECESCGTHFCTKCFIEKRGQKEFNRMLGESDNIYCPDCYGKIMVKEHMIFEEKASKIYPFKKKHKDLTEAELAAIVDACNDNFDTETLHLTIGNTVGFAEASLNP